MLSRAALRKLVESTAADLIKQGQVNAVQSVSTGEENGQHYVEIQLLIPEHIFEDDDLLDEVYLAFQTIESGETLGTVPTQPAGRSTPRIRRVGTPRDPATDPTISAVRSVDWSSTRTIERRG